MANLCGQKAKACDAAAAEDKKNYDVTEHLLSLDDLVFTMKTSLNMADVEKSEGLSSEAILQRRAQYGPNAMTPPKGTPEIVKFLKQFLNPFMVLLMIAGSLCFLCYGLNRDIPVNLYCGCALFSIVLVQSCITYLEERKNNSVMESLKKMVPAQCTVIRGGKLDRVPVADLVVGDVVKMKGGDRVPADVRIVKTNGLKVECSSLTGEPDAFEVTVEKTHDAPHETRNLTFSTSQCTEGSAYGIVVRTGDKTLIGLVASLAMESSGHVSTLQLELERVVYFIAGLGSLMALAILIIGFSQKLPAVIVINLVITIFVANVPEGLPAVVITSLGIAAKRMKEKKVLIKNLEIIETLGSTTCVCSDKTGTLTMNKMSVQNFWFNGHLELLQGKVLLQGSSTILSKNSYSGTIGSGNRRNSLIKAKGGVAPPAGEQIYRTMFQSHPLEPLLTIAAVCNAAKFLENADSGVIPEGALGGDVTLDRREVLGDASEAALLKYCDATCPIDVIRSMYHKVYDQPFNSTNKFALCVVNLPNKPGKQLVMFKGAPEIVLTRCTSWITSGQIKPVDDHFKQEFSVAYERFANGGERVLGFARLEIDALTDAQIANKEVPTQNLTFVGLTSLMDPPKPGVDKAVMDCHAAGIRVFMVTGDHALTAEAIARSVNIITMPTRKDVAFGRGVAVEDVDLNDPAIQAVVVTGHELTSYTEEKWAWLLEHPELVFARTTPQQKLEIVEHLQARGEIIAVTGDGVNDAPALKKANIGLSMGSPNASDVAREASDIIIMDDDFCSIVNGIREGRLVFDNLKKCIAYTLAHLPPEILPVLLNIIFLMPLALSSLLILLIDLGSELLPAVSLAYEEPEDSIMQKPPRNVKTDRLITKPLVVYSYLIAGMLEAATSMICWFVVLWMNGVDISILGFPAENWFVDGAPPLPSKKGLIASDQQLHILSQMNGATYMAIVFCQMFHLWLCRTRVTSFFQSNLLANRVCLLAILYDLAFIFILCYIPEMVPVFVSGEGIRGEIWAVCLGFAFVLGSWTELTKWAARRKVLKGESSCLSWFAW